MKVDCDVLNAVQREAAAGEEVAAHSERESADGGRRGGGGGGRRGSAECRAARVSVGCRRPHPTVAGPDSRRRQRGLARPIQKVAQVSPPSPLPSPPFTTLSRLSLESTLFDILFLILHESA